MFDATVILATMPFVAVLGETMLAFVLLMLTVDILGFFKEDPFPSIVPVGTDELVARSEIAKGLRSVGLDEDHRSRAA